MKKILVFGLAILLAMWIGVGMAEEKEQGDRKKASTEHKAWREKLEAMTPEQQQVAKAKRAFKNAVSDWEKVRSIAKNEGAENTVAAIDRIIATKRNQLNKRLASFDMDKAEIKSIDKKHADEKTKGNKGKGEKKNDKEE